MLTMTASQDNPIRPKQVHCLKFHATPEEIAWRQLCHATFWNARTPLIRQAAEVIIASMMRWGKGV